MRGIALDVEATKTDWEFPEKSGFKCASLLDFEWSSDGVKLRGFITFEESALPLLRERLLKHQGLILTFKGFLYDYRVLSSRIGLEGIVEKAVDITSWREERMFDMGLSPDFKQWVKQNIDDTQFAATGVMKSAWFGSDKRAVIESNQSDCYKLLQLWAKLVFERTIEVPYQRNPKSYRRLHVGEVDLKVLRGDHFLFSTDRWKRMKASSAKGFHWARSLQDETSRPDHPLGRKIHSYELVPVPRSGREAVFYCQKLRRHKLNQPFFANELKEGLPNVSISSVSTPVFLGFAKPKSSLSSSAFQGARVLFKSDGNIAYEPIPRCVERHLRDLKFEVDDPCDYRDGKRIVFV